MVESSLSFDNTGQKLTLSINIPYSDEKCIKAPDSCLKCPNGYSRYMKDCGRNVPFIAEDYEHRPSTCKLEQIDVRALIEAELERLGL